MMDVVMRNVLLMGPPNIRAIAASTCSASNAPDAPVATAPVATVASSSDASVVSNVSEMPDLPTGADTIQATMTLMAPTARTPIRVFEATATPPSQPVPDTAKQHQLYISNIDSRPEERTGNGRLLTLLARIGDRIQDTTWWEPTEVHHKHPRSCRLPAPAVVT
ncbi:hypothetical protein FN846DRAFT_971832 [Sphaerosporella brunnea]|uniref:Uncharacterized protein n=1 Tax=Sphaerosporella brunnea TaxID=1250544 RepID=A0A5J5EIU6_9PEZI|nr:hypothetical protein FN846DRAFT_971832 [Sphaerosporella brunnea]